MLFRILRTMYSLCRQCIVFQNYNAIASIVFLADRQDLIHLHLPAFVTESIVFHVCHFLHKQAITGHFSDLREFFHVIQRSYDDKNTSSL